MRKSLSRNELIRKSVAEEMSREDRSEERSLPRRSEDGVPLGMLERIRAKERAAIESKRRIALELQKNETESEVLQGLVDAMSSVYAVRGVGALYEDELIALFPGKETGQGSSGAEKRERLRRIVQLVPEFATMLRTSKGVVVRISKEQSAVRVKELLRTRLAAEKTGRA